MAWFDAKHRAKSMTIDVRSHFIGRIPDYLGRPDLLGKADPDHRGDVGDNRLLITDQTQ